MRSAPDYRKLIREYARRIFIAKQRRYHCLMGGSRDTTRRDLNAESCPNRKEVSMRSKILMMISAALLVSAAPQVASAMPPVGGGALTAAAELLPSVDSVHYYGYRGYGGGYRGGYYGYGGGYYGGYGRGYYGGYGRGYYGGYGRGYYGGYGRGYY
jgi:hypothetical protein